MTGEPEGMAPAPDPQIVDSPFKNLKERRRRIQGIKFKDIPVQGYDGALVARYRLMEWDDVQKISKRHGTSSDPRAILYSQVDLLIAALDQFYYPNGDGGLTPLDPEQPMRYEQRLAENLGYEARNARGVAIGLFVNEMALVAHHNDLFTWMTGEYGEVSEDFQGELEGPQS